jgi:hypothetical protein
MFYSLREVGRQVDVGRNAFGVVLQRKESDFWYDYLIDGKPVVIQFDFDYLIDGKPVVIQFDFETLPPGFYRLVESPIPTASD